MHRHCGTNNRAPRWTFTDPWFHGTMFPPWHSDVAAIVQRVNVTHQTIFPIPYPASTGVYQCHIDIFLFFIFHVLKYRLYSSNCRLYTSNCILYTSNCRLYSLKYIIDSLKCIIDSLKCIIDSLKYIILTSRCGNWKIKNIYVALIHFRVFWILQCLVTFNSFIGLLN